jgi:hypothetical protein
MKFPLKSIIPAVVFGLAVAPANAETAHRTSVVHEGRTIAVHYEPQIETKFRQTGIGPRSTPQCLWSAKVSVQRTAVNAEGQPIAALTRVVGEGKPRGGARLGHCSSVSERPASEFVGSDAALRTVVADAAGADAAALHGELASLASFTTKDAHAR